MLSQKDTLDVLSQQVEVRANLRPQPCYGDKDDTGSLYRSQAKCGVAAFRTYVTLYAHVKNEHYALAMRRLEDGNTASGVLAELLGIPDGLDFGVKVVYLNRELYDSECLTLLQTHNHAYVMPIVRWGRMTRREFSEGWSRMVRHSLIMKLDGHNWAIGFPVYIDCIYQNERYGGRGTVRRGYAADALLIGSPRDIRYHYVKRFGIEANCRLSEQGIATTSAQNPVIRLSYIVASPLLQNIWRYLHWECVATPRRGRRHF